MRKRGSVLIVVMGFTSVIAFLCYQVIHTIQKEVGLAGFSGQREELRMVAYQALELSLASLQEIKELDKDLYSPSQGWVDLGDYFGASLEENENGENAFKQTLIEVVPVQFSPEIELEIITEDESGKIPLNENAEVHLKHFFEIQGLNTTEVQILTDSLLDWMDSDKKARLNGAEQEYYRNLEPPVLIKNKLLEDEKELLQIHGFDSIYVNEDGVLNEKYGQFWTVFTLQQHTTINYNTANELVLEVLDEEAGFDYQKVLQYLAGTDGIRYTQDDNVLRPDSEESDSFPRDKKGTPLPSSESVGKLKFQITARSGNTQYILSAVVDMKTSGEVYPFTITQLLEEQALINRETVGISEPFEEIQNGAGHLNEDALMKML